MRLRPLSLLLILVLFGALSGPVAPARAQWVGRYFLFDRAVWSPDSRSVAVIGRFLNTGTGETFDDTLLVDAETGSYQCISPSATRFTLSRDGSRILALGRWGLYDYEVATGRIEMLRSSDPFFKNEIAAFSYTRNMDAAICIRCADDDPDSSGVYSYQLHGGSAVRLLPDPQCGAQSLNYWQSHRRDQGPTDFSLPTLENPTIIPNFPGTLWQVRIGDRVGTAVWGNGDVPPDTLCRDCRVEMNSWPGGGGVALASTSPEDIKDILTPGDLWLLRPSAPTRHLARGRFENAAWKDSTTAYVLARPGVLWKVNAVEGTAAPVSMSLAPEWLWNSPLASSPRVWTLGIENEVYAHPDSARARAIYFRQAGAEGYNLEALPDRPGYLLSVGSFPDSASAARARAGLLRAATDVRLRGDLTIQPRPVSSMQGLFDFGGVTSPDGRRRVFFRSHPHMFQPYIASEVWLESRSESRPRMLLRSMSNF